MRSLNIETLSEDRIDQAYPLVHLVRPRLDPTAWRDYAVRVLASADSGICVLSDPRKLILGLFVWHVTDDPNHGRTLACDDFVALDIVDNARVAAALADGLEVTARQQGCAAVHTSISAAAGSAAQRMVERLRGLGHEMERFQLCKPLSLTG